ncbi:MAG: Hpt domain-containing protein [Chitinophagaceae bacterium]|nr:Hpt domain-containing protein [Oligoflexus sp.]
MSFRSTTLNELVILADQMKDATLLTDVVNIFIEQAPLQTEELARATLRLDAEMIVFYAHKLKTSCAVVGADQLCDICLTIEKSALLSMKSIPPLVAKLKTAISSECERIQDELKTYKATPGQV